MDVITPLERGEKTKDNNEKHTSLTFFLAADHNEKKESMFEIYTNVFQFYYKFLNRNRT